MRAGRADRLGCPEISRQDAETPKKDPIGSGRSIDREPGPIGTGWVPAVAGTITYVTLVAN